MRENPMPANLKVVRLVPPAKSEEQQPETSAPVVTSKNFRPLPERRSGFTCKIKLTDDLEIILQTSEYEPSAKEKYGRPGEIRIAISNMEVGKNIQNYLDLLGQTISTGLQHGTPLKAYIDQYVADRNFGNRYTISAHADTSIRVMDAVFQSLAVHYLDMPYLDLPIT